MEKNSKFSALNVFLSKEKKQLPKLKKNKVPNVDKSEDSVFITTDFITLREALAISGGKKSGEVVVDKQGVCSEFMQRQGDYNENDFFVCENCVHGELKPKTFFFKERYFCKIGKGPEYTSPRNF